jgi:predicted  nucleic acid-binding Zn-ribbon protein
MGDPNFNAPGEEAVIDGDLLDIQLNGVAQLDQMGLRDLLQETQFLRGRYESLSEEVLELTKRSETLDTRDGQIERQEASLHRLEDVVEAIYDMTRKVRQGDDE